jgi:hypothetical protein
MIERGARPRQDLPHLVAVLSGGDEIVGFGGADGGERLARGPALGGDDSDAAGAGGGEGEGLGAAGVLEQRERFPREDLGVSRQFEQCNGGVERVYLARLLDFRRRW